VLSSGDNSGENGRVQTHVLYRLPLAETTDLVASSTLMCDFRSAS